MMITTLTLSTRLAPGEVLAYMIGLMLDVHSKSNKPKIDPLFEQCLRKSA